ncbi:acetyl-CoA C-acetyltransferase [Shewanella submarina]|uniref:Acetyl-CoA C-acetyltransferase n=1 Tax=Shewanella submarina TaxID=2016376 RepID=A0ABV7GFA9_9GAMM|nr:acetyl-CoA C-acetyltransferase [Shewanella submarina]MCL1039159.1 acetyl-CoA C-acetyltransferase [Shewanella submarina]
MERVYIAAARRTPIGSFGGSLKSVSVGQLGARVIKAVLADTGIAPEAVDEVILGNVVGTGQGMGPGRQAALFAGLPNTTPAYSLNMVCGSGMKTVMDAVAHIRAGEADIVVAAGAENMSQIPFMAPASLRQGQKMGDISLKDLLVSDGLTDVFNQYHMGVTAENIANELDISRERQDAFALTSQQRAVAALEANRFADETTPVEVTERRKTRLFEKDEYPKADASAEALAGLRPAFAKEGSVTAGNASGLNDGASAILVVSGKALQQHKLTPLAEIVVTAQTGIEPRIMGLGPVAAVTRVLEKAGLTLADIDLLELNEAFAAQALGVAQQLAEQHGDDLTALLERTNVNGGAIALGHPLGASGNRILVTLLHELKRRGGQYGVASLCIGGGMGTAVLIRNC